MKINNIIRKLKLKSQKSLVKPVQARLQTTFNHECHNKYIDIVFNASVKYLNNVIKSKTTDVYKLYY